MVKIAPTSSQPTSDVEPAVYVIDDDAGVRDSLGLLFRSVGLRAELFRSANEFLQRKLPPNPSCLVLDVRLPGLSGFELHAELTRVNIQIPIIFITAHGDIPMSVRAMKAAPSTSSPSRFAIRICWMPSPPRSPATGRGWTPNGHGSTYKAYLPA